MIIMKMANLGLRFVLELCMLAALGYWGFHVGKGMIVKSALGIGAPLIAAVLWGMFVAPKASIAIAEPYRLLIELVIFASATAALYVSGRQSLAVTFALVYLINRALIFIWNQ
ncbi:YrdB family protein [Paenibacillus sp. GCM10027628]|uniref:YrdB family protein n=1 Tax=Paenibacillus sp. GCM10027628 TaxID=3273413 RepID=UPI0036340AE1